MTGFAKGSQKALAAGKKAALTKSKNYNAPGKNKFRDEVVSNFDPHGITLALESAQGLFVKALPKAMFYLFECDDHVYSSLIEMNRPNVVAVFNSDISAARLLQDIPFKQGFFDFCNSLDGNIDCIDALYPLVNRMDVVAFTFSQRSGKVIKTEDREYAVRINNVLSERFPEFKIVSCRVYNDTSTMVGVILKKKTPWCGEIKPIEADRDKIAQCEVYTKQGEIISIIRNWMEGYAMAHWNCPLLGELSDENVGGNGVRILGVCKPLYLVKVGCNIQISGTERNYMFKAACRLAEERFSELLQALPWDMREAIITLHRNYLNDYVNWENCLSLQGFILKYIIDDRAYRNQYEVRLESFPEASDAYKKYILIQTNNEMRLSSKIIESAIEELSKERKIFEETKLQWEERRANCEKLNAAGDCPEFCSIVRKATQAIEKQHRKECDAFKIAIKAIAEIERGEMRR